VIRGRKADCITEQHGENQDASVPHQPESAGALEDVHLFACWTRKSDDKQTGIIVERSAGVCLWMPQGVRTSDVDHGD
jgi:hypothetical protein